MFCGNGCIKAHVDDYDLDKILLNARRRLAVKNTCHYQSNKLWHYHSDVIWCWWMVIIPNLCCYVLIILSHDLWHFVSGKHCEKKAASRDHFHIIDGTSSSRRHNNSRRTMKTIQTDESITLQKSDIGFQDYFHQYIPVILNTTDWCTTKSKMKS